MTGRRALRGVPRQMGPQRVHKGTKVVNKPAKNSNRAISKFATTQLVVLPDPPESPSTSLIRPSLTSGEPVRLRQIDYEHSTVLLRN